MQLEVKKMVWETNYNQKMGCNAFVHVDVLPKKFPSLTVLNKYVFEIATKDDSHPPIFAKLTSILAFPLHQLTDQIAMPSHGFDALELADALIKKHYPNIHFNSPLAIYYYQKQKPEAHAENND